MEYASSSEDDSHVSGQFTSISPFSETRKIIARLQEPASGPNPESAEPNPHLYTLFI
jgi:hypothetical protein